MSRRVKKHSIVGRDWAAMELVLLFCHQFGIPIGSCADISYESIGLPDRVHASVKVGNGPVGVVFSFDLFRMSERAIYDFQWDHLPAWHLEGNFSIALGSRVPYRKPWERLNELADPQKKIIEFSRNNEGFVRVD